MRRETAKAILQNIKETYDLISADFSNTRKTDWEEFETIIKYISNNNQVADIGCGNGRFYKFISKKKNIKYTGIDNNKLLLQEAKKLNKTKFKTGDLLKIPLDENSQDVTVCIAAFHHIPSQELRKKAMTELARITRPKGIVVITVWNLLQQEKYKKHVVKAFLKWLYSFGKYERRGLLIPWGNKKIPRYYYAFKEKELEKLLLPHYKIIKKSRGKNLLYICEKK